MTDRPAVIDNVYVKAVHQFLRHQFSHDLVEIETYAASDPNDIGKMLPQVYGSAYRVPFRAVNIGAYSTLTATINDEVTTITLTDSSDFPSSGTVQIEDEQITYTGNTSNQLTGCSRGANSTSADEHKAGETAVEVKDNLLTLRGERKDDPEVPEDRYYRRERTCGNFLRAFTLQAPLEPDKIKATFKDGVLKVTLPHPQEDVPKRIQVNID